MNEVIPEEKKKLGRRKARLDTLSIQTQKMRTTDIYNDMVKTAEKEGMDFDIFLGMYYKKRKIPRDFDDFMPQF